MLWSACDKLKTLWFFRLHFAYNSCFFYKQWVNECMCGWVSEQASGSACWGPAVSGRRQAHGARKARPSGGCTATSGPHPVWAEGIPGQFCLGGHVRHLCPQRRGNSEVTMFSAKNGSQGSLLRNNFAQGYWQTVPVCVCLYVTSHLEMGDTNCLMSRGMAASASTVTCQDQDLRSTSSCPWPWTALSPHL